MATEMPEERDTEYWREPREPREPKTPEPDPERLVDPEIYPRDPEPRRPGPKDECGNTGGRHVWEAAAPDPDDRPGRRPDRCGDDEPFEGIKKENE